MVEAKPVSIDTSYQMILREPMLEIIVGEPRIALLQKILKTFALHVNEITFREENPRTNHFQFSKFYEQAFFNVTWGLEEISGVLRNPREKNQIESLFRQLHDLVKPHPIVSQKFAIQHQLAIADNPLSFIDSLSPFTPEPFRKMLTGKSVAFNLRDEQKKVSIIVSLAPSLFVPNGLFLSIEYNFTSEDFTPCFEVAVQYYPVLVKSLNIAMVGLSDG